MTESKLIMDTLKEFEAYAHENLDLRTDASSTP